MFVIVWQARIAPKTYEPSIIPEFINHKFPENHCIIDVKVIHFDILKLTFVESAKDLNEKLSFLTYGMTNNVPTKKEIK